MDNTPLSFENIIHRGTRETVTCIQHKDTYTAISDACASVGSRLTLPIYGEVEVKKISLFKTIFSYRNTECSIATFSPCQILNAITVIEAAHALCRVGVNISEEAISRGLSKANLSLKCEVVSVEPTIIVASATNEKQIEALAASLAQVKEHLPSKISVFSPPSSDRLVRDISSNCYINFIINISQRLLSCEIETGAVTLIEDSSSSLFKRQIKDIITPVMRVEQSNDALLFIGEREYVFELVIQIRKNLGNM